MRTALYLVLAIAVTAPTAFPAVGAKLGIGAAAGFDIPILQDDQSRGFAYGIKARLDVIPLLTLEPNLFFTKYGDPELAGDDFGGITSDLKGSKVTAYGIDALLGAGFAAPGLRPYFVAGAGFYNYKRDQTGQNDTDLGFSAGAGLELGFAVPIALDVRGKLVVIPIEGGSKKSAVITGGLIYYLGK